MNMSGETVIGGESVEDPFEVLLVEDNPADVRLTREAFRAGPYPCRVRVAEDGESALRMLHRDAPFEHAPRPHLVLLDLNLPRRDGREVLSDIKSDRDLRAIVVIVLTSSDAEEDVAASYALLANCYIVKPVDYDGLVSLIREIESFWLGVARLPRAA